MSSIRQIRRSPAHGQMPLWDVWETHKKFWNSEAAQDCGKAGPTLVADALTDALLQTRNSPISLWNLLWPHLSTVLPVLPRHLEPYPSEPPLTGYLPWTWLLSLNSSVTRSSHGPESVLLRNQPSDWVCAQWPNGSHTYLAHGNRAGKNSHIFFIFNGKSITDVLFVPHWPF